jgi:predicted nucleic acid-binding protein
VRLYLDTNIFIYAMETDYDEGLRARRCLHQIERREIEAITSELSLAEALRGGNAPLRPNLSEAYMELLSPGAELGVIAVTRGILIKSASSDVERKIGLADAIHVATALEGACDAILTEDKGLPTPAGLRKLSLADWISHL